MYLTCANSAQRLVLGNGRHIEIMQASEVDIGALFEKKIVQVEMSKLFLAIIAVLFAFTLPANCGREIKRSKVGCAKCGEKTQKFHAFRPIQSLNISEVESAFDKKVDSGDIRHSCLRRYYKWRITGKITKEKKLQASQFYDMINNLKIKANYYIIRISCVL